MYKNRKKILCVLKIFIIVDSYIDWNIILVFCKVYGYVLILRGLFYIEEDVEIFFYGYLNLIS